MAQTLFSLYESLTNMGEDVQYLHADLMEKYRKYQKNNTQFDETFKGLVNSIGYNSNVMSGIYKNAHLQKQIDNLTKIILSFPADIRAKYVKTELLAIMGE